MRSKLTYIAASVIVLFAACDNGGPVVPMDNNNGMMDQPMMSVNAREAQGWYERAWPEVMAQSGAVMADLDENSGKVTFGVENAGIAKATAAILRARGIDDDAYTVKLMAPIEEMTSLQGSFSPKVGGIQIHFTQYLCTLGFNATLNGQNSFITNSHCTGKQGGVENTLYYQPTSTVDPTVIAQEVADPTYGPGGECPKGRKCRYSDSSRAVYRSGISFTLGKIAAPSTLGSLNATGEHTITDDGDISSGTVNKVGRTTGWTQGNITASCAVINVSGGNITQLCQNVVQATGSSIIVDHGDSGSPVFTGTGNVRLVGILWGGSTDNKTFIYSQISRIRQELGNFTVR